MKKYTGQDITCVMSVYNGTDIKDLKQAINSVENQTVKMRKFIIVVDGLISKVLTSYLSGLMDCSGFYEVLYLQINKGPGFARDYGIRKVKTKLVAIMDSDDISVPNRFELQLFNFNRLDISVCGGSIIEFNSSTFLKERRLPSKNDELISFSKLRSPINNVTAMIVLDDYLSTGGYPDFRLAEDYCLWLRFISKGFKLYNTKEVLVHVRFDDDTIDRRNGLALFKFDYLCQLENFKLNNIGFLRLSLNLVSFFIFRMLLPKKMIKLLYKYLFRN